MFFIIKPKYAIGLKIIYRFLSWIFFFITSFTFGQEENFQTPDSLKDKNYSYLIDKSNKNYKDTVVATMYLKTYLAKANINNDTIKKSVVLGHLSYYSKNKKHKLELINQSILTGISADSLYAMFPYNLLGIYYHREYNYEKALENYLTALDISRKYKKEDYELSILNNIAELKKEVEKHDEALLLFRKCLDIERKKEEPNKFTIMHIYLNLSESFRKKSISDSASFYYKKITENYTLNDSNYFYKSLINEGVNQYNNKNITLAKKLLFKGSSEINLTTLENQQQYILSQFYLGKITVANDKKKALNYFLKVDSLLGTYNIILPEVRESYEILLQDYESSKNYNAQIIIGNRLRKFDSIIAVRKLNTINKLYSSFDTPELLKNKESIIQELKNKILSLNFKIVFLIIPLIIFFFLFFVQYRKRKVYKKRFENILKKLEQSSVKEETETIVENISTKKTDINPIIITTILNKLNDFESNHGFLKNTITIATLAKKTSTNTKYLSKVINTYKEKSFTQYINDLRIDYVIQELKINTTLQRYTILSISKEIGFNSVDSFTKAFKKKTGITPAYYIKSLHKQ